MSFIKKLPNFLTVSRIILVPFICVLMYIDVSWTRVLSTVLVILAAATDYLDGYIARNFNASTKFGKCMDPISDKLLVISVMVMLIYLEKADIFASLIILFREVLVSGVREFMALSNIVIHVSRVAKWKTAIHMIAVIVLMFSGLDFFFLIAGNVLLYLAAFLAVLSSVDYMKIAFKSFK
jgi:CDP-diacylglycerol--glycerol-3-phosphate 3-phosphatidyltransferase